MSRIRITLGGPTWAGFGELTATAGSLTRDNGEPDMPEKRRTVGGFLGMDFLIGAVFIKLCRDFRHGERLKLRCLRLLLRSEV